MKPEISEEDVRNIILNRSDGGRRAYRNTVAAVCPSAQINFDTLLLHIAKIKASEEIETTLGEYYTDKDILSIQQKKLKSFRQDNEKLLKQQILASLTRIAYPTKPQTEDEVKWVDATPSASIISQVEASLKDAKTGPKLRTSISFNDLSEFLKRNQTWDLIEDEKRYEFSDIMNVFSTTTTAPFITKTTLELAVKLGLESLDIGVLMDGNLYWKQVGPQGGSDTITRMKDAAEILPYKLAAKALSEKLKSQTGIIRESGIVRRVWFEVEIAGRRLNLEDLLIQSNWKRR